MGPPVLLSPETSVPELTRAIGVGSNAKDPIAEVRGAKGGSW